jgi:glycosyltransferase involved in cell wall biosynthesis
MLDSKKNVTGILNTMSKLESKIPNIELVLIGENSEKYKKHANILQLKKITYINHITQQQLVNYFQEASLFLLFSNHENLPCVILESFSSGTPVISTNVGGVSEFFPNNFGTLIPVKDENKLYEEILNFYSKEKILETSTEMHSYAVNNFSKSTICGKFTEIYYESINNKKVI